jgi:UDP-N-acetylmuramate--alanine ligase
MTFQVVRPNDSSELKVELAIPGHHNVLNALAAIAIATYLGVQDDAIVDGLKTFQGIGRRFEILADLELDQKNITVVDDYAHHPVELAATLSAAKGCWPDRRVVAVFQPHRYSRTHDLFDDFVQVLSTQQDLLISEVYPAGEQVVSGATGGALCQAIRVRGISNPVFVSEVSEFGEVLRPMLQDGDVVLTMGAGTIGRAVRDWVDQAKLSQGGR